MTPLATYRAALQLRLAQMFTAGQRMPDGRVLIRSLYIRLMRMIAREYADD